MCGRQNNLVNKTVMRAKWWHFDNLFIFPTVSDSRPVWSLIFLLWWNSIFRPKLHMTSEEEGGAKPSLSSNYREKSHHQPPSLSRSQSLPVPQLRAGLRTGWEQRLEETERVEENGEHEPAWETQLRRQAGSDLHLLIHRLNPLTEVRYTVCEYIDSF